MDSSSVLYERGFNNSSPQFQFSNATEQQNATFALFNNLVFAQSKSVRTSTIILASFNVLAAFVTAASILYDCHLASKRCNPKFKDSKFCMSSMHPAETFPLVLAIGIVVQGLAFAAVQGEGMSSLMAKNCDVIAQFMFPALFIVPYIQVVFGLECAIRSLRTLPFRPRGKYDVTICGAVVALLLVATWVPSFIFKQQSICFASLMWFIGRYGGVGTIILSVVGGVMIISAITIFVRLSTATLVDQHQRIAASRMVYYLVLGIVSLSLILPFFISQMVHKKGSDLKLSMIATVVVNLSGLMSGLLHLFLRSNTSSSSFGPKSSRHWNRGKHEIRIWGPNELVFGTHLQEPVSGPRSPQELPADTDRSESRASLIGMDKMSMRSMTSPPFRSPTATQTYPPMSQINTVVTLPEPSKSSPTAANSKRHTRKQSYSLFPTDATSPSRGNDNPVSIYDITGLAPPPSFFEGGSKGHKRDSSVISSATVQIGLRLSHAPGISQDYTQSIGSSPLPSTTYNPNKPVLSYSNTTLSPMTFGGVQTQRQRSRSPLQVLTAIDTGFSTSEPPPRSPRRQIPPPLITTSLSNILSSPGSTPCFNKDLPPTPRAELAPAVEALRATNTKLTTATYSPFADHQNTPINGLPTHGPKCPRGNTSPVAVSPTRSPTRSPYAPQRPSQRKDWI